MPRFLFAVLPTLLALATAPLAAKTDSHAQQEQRSLNLSTGCNMATLTFATGTDTTTLATAVSPANGLRTVWPAMAGRATSKSRPGTLLCPLLD